MGQRSVKMQEGPVGTIIPIKEGLIECSAPNQIAFFEDNISCFFFQLPYFLDRIGFRNICTGFVLIVTVIAVFKCIKSFIHFYIFNILFIDLLVCFEFLSNREIDNNGFQNCHIGLSHFITYNTHPIYRFPAIGLLLFAKFLFFNNFDKNEINLNSLSDSSNIIINNYFNSKSVKFWKTFLCKLF